MLYRSWVTVGSQQLVRSAYTVLSVCVCVCVSLTGCFTGHYQCWWICIFMISCGWNPCGIQTALIEYWRDALRLSLLPSVLYTLHDYMVMWSKLQAFYSTFLSSKYLFLKLHNFWNADCIHSSFLIHRSFFFRSLSRHKGFLWTDSVFISQM